MMRIFFSLLWALLAQTAIAQKVINDPNAELRTVASFHAIDIANDFDVIITQSNEEKVAVSAISTDKVKMIQTTVENGVLKIRFNEDKFWKGSKKLKAYIAVKNI